MMNSKSKINLKRFTKVWNSNFIFQNSASQKREDSYLKEIFFFWTIEKQFKQWQVLKWYKLNDFENFDLKFSKIKIIITSSENKKENLFLKEQ